MSFGLSNKLMSFELSMVLHYVYIFNHDIDEYFLVSSDSAHKAIESFQEIDAAVP